ncbi:MAG: RNA 3'-terminal phosphate cyclase [Planctomycetota bacterium]
MSSTLHIDGSFGEGGGQIVRSSLALAALTGRSVEITNMRAGRKKPGLQRQHLVAVRAAAEVTHGSVEGDELGSTHILFEPGHTTGGTYHLPIGTAGSTSLVMQTVLMPLLLAGQPSTLKLGGGTHNPMAPPYEFLRDTYLPQLRAMGGEIMINLKQAGYFPKGGGEVDVTIEGINKLRPIELMERGKRLNAHALIRLAQLPEHIAERQAKTVRRKLGWPDLTVEIDHQPNAWGPGNAVVLTVQYEHTTEVFTSIGERGKPAERVAEAAIKEALSFDASRAAVGEHLADQLMLPLALAGGGRYRASCLSLHTTTHAELIQRFLDVPITLEPDGDPASPGTVIIGV